MLFDFAELNNVSKGNLYLSLYNKIKSVARFCRSCVVWSSYSENNKILGVYSGKNPAAEPAGQTVGRGAADAEMSAGAVSGANCKKWLISAIFEVPFKSMFNALMFNVIQKAQSSTVFHAVRTFFLKMFPYGKPIGGHPPKTAKGIIDISGSDFFSISARKPFAEIGQLFSKTGLGIKGFTGR